MQPIYLREATVTFRTVRKAPRHNFELTAIRDSRTVYELLAPVLQDRIVESLLVLALNSRQRALGYHEVARGSVSRCACAPADVFRFPLVVGANAIALAHNHPSGDPSPSAEDLAFTRKLVSLGRELGISILDHIVIGDGYTSMLDAGMM